MFNTICNFIYNTFSPNQLKPLDILPQADLAVQSIPSCTYSTAWEAAQIQTTTMCQVNSIYYVCHLVIIYRWMKQSWHKCCAGILGTKKSTRSSQSNPHSRGWESNTLTAWQTDFCQLYIYCSKEHNLPLQIMTGTGIQCTNMESQLEEFRPQTIVINDVYWLPNFTQWCIGTSSMRTANQKSSSTDLQS